MLRFRLHNRTGTGSRDGTARRDILLQRVFALLGAAVLLPACSERGAPGPGDLPGDATPAEPAVVEKPTFSRDIAPIVFARCSGCHREGESAPFALLAYEDVRKRGPQIADVLATGYMPPWLPAPQEHAFADERRLSGSEKDTIRRWVSQGMPEGDAEQLPVAPAWTDGWQLGPPDLVVTLAGDYLLPAEGADVFRSFVLPVALSSPRYVRSVEVRPENPGVVHHGVILVDRTRAGRRLDAQDSEPGYPGMQQPHLITSPEGHFLGWTPGKLPKHGPEDMAWKLEPGTDLVAALHMLPSGKPEPVRLRVGLHFTDRAPSRQPVMVKLEQQALDIAPGDAAHVVEDSFPLPVDVTALGIYPHAHYLARTMHVTATGPGGRTIDLLRIDDWDFNWQDDYRYATPVPLAAGTVIAMRFVYDNSEKNTRNPNHPPRRVTYGELSSDEMGSLWLQVLPKRASDHERLLQALMRKRTEQAIAGFRFALQQDPRNPEALSNLGAALGIEGNAAEARRLFEAALAADADHLPAHLNYGLLLAEIGETTAAAQHFEKVVEIDPHHAQALNSLGHLASGSGDYRRALEHFKRAAEIQPDAQSAYNLGVTSIALHQIGQAISLLERATELDPAEPLAHLNLGACYFNTGDWSRAEIRFRNVIRLEPGFAAAWLNLGNALAKQDRMEEAVGALEQATRLDPENVQAWESLQAARQFLQESR